MSSFLNDIKNVDVVLTGSFGSYTIRNYGSNDTSITVESLDNKLYNAQEGAFGDMLLNKSYKAKNMRLRINVLRKSTDFARLRAIVALELAGEALQFEALAKDNNSSENVYCPKAVMEEVPATIWGVNPEDNVEFLVLLPSAVYTPPTLTEE
jgi:hypothetical protein